MPPQLATTGEAWAKVASSLTTFAGQLEELQRRMTALAHRVILAWGWSRALVAFIAGAAGAFAMPPFGVLPALAVSLTVAVWLLDGAAAPTRLRTLLSAALAGWCWGFGYFVAGLWWLGSAFLAEADRFA